MDFLSNIIMAVFRSKCSGVKSSPIGSPGGTGMNEVVKLSTRNMKDIRIATWNARSLYAAGKLANVTAEMERLKLSILGISDVQWPGSGKCETTNGMFYYAGNDNSAHRYGVGIIIEKEINKSVIGFTPYSDRIIVVHLESNKGKINVIQVYAPTADKEDNEVEIFYAQLINVLESIKKEEVTIIMGDFNAKVGTDKTEGCTGGFGLGQRNERGERLIEFCQSEELVIMNTMFQLPNRRLYTWRSPMDNKQKIIRNQIDYILIRNRFKNSITSAKTYPGADIGSDHNPVVAVLNIRLKTLKCKGNRKDMDIKRLNEESVLSNAKEKVNHNIRNIKEENKNPENVNEKWRNIKTALLEAGKDTLTPIRTKKKAWMTDEILDLMEERRTNKARNEEKYKELNRTIKGRIKEAREQWLSDNCKEIEEYERRYDVFNMHKKIKEITGMKKSRQASVLKDKNGKLIINIEDKLKRWTEYIEELFKDDRPEIEIETDETGPEILKSEVEYAIKNMKMGKAVGPDKVPAELLKLIDNNTIDIMVNLFNTIYRTGIIPTEWLGSTFVTLPKKKNAKDCSEYRTIALMSHTLKVFLKIIHKRIFKRLEEDLSDTQLGFRNGLGTREALFGVSVLMQRCLDINQDLYICFIDYEKAFDKVRHEKLCEILKSKNIDSRDIRIITKLYWHQTAKVKIENTFTREIKICRGVRQGCVLSPLLFNIYSEAICQEALLEENAGITINGEIINNIRYADDTLLMADNLKDLQHLLENINTHSNNYGLKLNLKKTKLMVVSKKQNIDANLTISNVQIERVTSYKYLGAWITEANEQNKEIKARIEIARQSFIKMRKFLCCRDINLNLRMRMLRCYVFSTLLYGVEAWTLKQANIKNIEAFEIWCYRRIWKIAWTDRVTNKEVLTKMGKECELIKTIKRRKLEYLGHVMRGDKYILLRLIIQGKIKGRRSMGRRRISWLRNLREWYGCTSNELFRAAVNKVKIAMMIANLR